MEVKSRSVFCVCVSVCVYFWGGVLFVFFLGSYCYVFLLLTFTEKQT